MKKLITKALAITLSSFILGANLLYAQDVNKPTDSITEEYDENGRLQAEGKYTVVVIEIGGEKISNNVRIGSWNYFYPNGKISEQVAYNKKGEREGGYSLYYENGQLNEIGEFLSGNKSGSWIEYHLNGKKAAVGSYVNGSPKGSWQYFDSEGKSINVNVAERQIQNILNQQLQNEIQARLVDTTAYPGHKFTLVEKFQIANKLLTIEVKRVNPNTGEVYHEKQEVELNKIVGISKDINTILETKPDAVKITYKNAKQVSEIKYSNQFLLYLSYNRQNEYLADDLIAVFKSAGYQIKKGGWYD